jgi:hypothetical protein
MMRGSRGITGCPWEDGGSTGSERNPYCGGPVRRGTRVWIGLHVLLIGGTICETPDMALNFRYHRNFFTRAGDNVERAVPDKLIAADREAGEVLRYAIMRRSNYASRRNAKVLATEYPQNEFFLTESVERLAQSKHADQQETMAVVDKLLALEPGNTYYRYLKGWVLLKIPDGQERVAKDEKDATIADLAVMDGGVMLIALIVFIAFCGRHLSSRRDFLWQGILWTIFWVPWIYYPQAIADLSSAKDAGSRSLRRRPKIAYGLLWLNGTILLLISNSSFFGSGRFSGGSQSIPLLMIWPVFCTLLWISMRDRKPVLGRVPYKMAVATAVCGAAFLLSLDTFGAQWYHENRAWAEPLSFRAPLPATTQEVHGKVAPNASVLPSGGPS